MILNVRKNMGLHMGKFKKKTPFGGHPYEPLPILKCHNQDFFMGGGYKIPILVVDIFWSKT
jgi:hypothetical protein